MILFTRHMSTSTLLLLLIVNLTFILCIHAQCNRAIALEKCSEMNDCDGFSELNAFPEAVCIGRDGDDELQNCPNSNVDLCLCFPASLKFCSAHDQCPDRQYCGISPRTGNSVCIGCRSLGDEDVNFKPLTSVPDNRCVDKDEDQVCGAVLDYCSPTEQCQDGNTCVVFSGLNLFSCSESTSPCRCSVSPPGETQITTAACESNDDCSSNREACGFDVRTRMNYCMSCDAIRNDEFLTITDSSKCDALEKQRDPPQHYFDSSNGKTYDLCLTDDQCTDGLTCNQFVSIIERPLKVEPCSSPDELCFCRNESLVKCTTGQDCPVGESCVISESVEANEHCVSNALIQARSTTEYAIIGKFTPNPKGQRLTNEKCRFDWNCKGERRCTHLLESWGGCAGRGACTCRPLINPSCSSHNECDDGESCMKFLGSDASTFCSSDSLLDTSPGVFGLFDEEEPKPTPVSSRGLTDDPCLFDTDCVDGRSCKHANEVSGSCNGRNYCFCQPEQMVTCDTSVDCTAGEICSGYKGVYPAENKNCISADAFDADTSGFREEFGNRPTVLPTRSPSVSAEPSSIPAESSPTPDTSADDADDKDDAKDPEETNINIGSVSIEPSNPLEPITIEPSNVIEVVPSPSIEASIIPDGENSEINSDGDSVSTTEAEQSVEESEICIDMKLLKDLKKEDLVFHKAKRASVLCDHNISCATAGHMVVYKNQAMSMKSYCEQHVTNGCAKRVAFVNSPRMKYGLRISSLTSNLHMTAHSSRYQSWIEEVILTRMINHLGV